VRLIAESFAWPFRARPSTWIWGCVCVLLLPVLFMPLFGYAIWAIRSSELDPRAPPPRWEVTFRTLWLGGWTVLLVAVITAPFAYLLNPVANLLDSAGIHFAIILAALVLALPWGVAMLLVVPHAAAAVAASGEPHDLFDVASVLRMVRRDLPTWNLVVAAIVTAWAIGIACAGLLCVGIVPGVFYAILVSAHAAAALHHPIATNPGSSSR
jgi:uncharacterized protein DUF4013